MRAEFAPVEYLRPPPLYLPQQIKMCLLYPFVRAALRGLGSIHTIMRWRPVGRWVLQETIWFAIHFALLSETSDLSDLRPFASDLIGCGNLKCGEINYFQCLGLAFA